MAHPTGVADFSDRHATLRLILQSHLCSEPSALDMRLFGTGLVAATPGGPVQHLVDGRRWLPDEREEQAPHLGHRQRQQVRQINDP